MTAHIMLVGRATYGSQPTARLRRLAAALSQRTGAVATFAMLDGGDPALPAALDAATGAGATAITLVPVPIPADPVHGSWTERVASHWAAQRPNPPALTVLRPRADDPTLTGALAELIQTSGRQVRAQQGAISDPAWSQLPPFRHHVLVCRGPRCSTRGAGDTAAALTAALEHRGFGDDDVLVTLTGCLYPCNHGPVLVVNPSNTWYGPATPELAAKLVDEHLVGGTPLPRSRIRPELS